MIDIEYLITYVQTQMQTNDFAIAGVLSAAAFTILGYAKSIPRYLYARGKRLVQFSITVEQSQKLYIYLNKYISDTYPNKLRKLEVVTKEFYGSGYSTENKKDGIKYRGISDYFHIIKGWRVINISKSREKLENARSFDSAYMGKITISGLFAGKVIMNMLENIEKDFIEKEVKDEKLYKHIQDGSHWDHTVFVPDKTVNHIFFPEKEEILQDINIFVANKDLYNRRGIQWYYGLLLKGDPGSGKTTFGMALAHYLKRNLYIMNLASMSDSQFISCFNKMDSNSLLLIDDVDIGLKSRDDKDKTGVNVSTLLSCFDGNMSRGDLVVVMTTNNIDALDPALIRKGRIDKIMEVSLPDKESIQDYINMFFDRTNTSITNVPQVSMCEIQNICLKNDYDRSVELIQEL